MNRNTEAHFSQLPTLDISRSKFDMGHTHITTGNTGDLIPVYVDMDIVPGDTVTMRQSEIIRMMTPITPVMDNAFMDFYWFFVPNRLVWSDFKKFMGENETAPWTQTQDIKVPQIIISNKYKNSSDALTTSVLKGSVINYMGVPVSKGWTYSADETRKIEVSTLPLRAYCLVWNEFFRDENLQNPININKDSTSRLLRNTNWADYISDPDAVTVQQEQNGGLPPLKVCKPHDYFTSCLPGPQKGPSVTIPQLGTAPVKMNAIGSEEPVTDYGYVNQNVELEGGNAYLFGTEHYGLDSLEDTPSVPTAPQFSNVQLYAELSEATAATINQLRQAFAIQKFYEREARGGTRYIESVWSHFRVRNPDYRLQRPEYLGGFRQNININQVIQSTPTIEDSTGLGTTGAYSVTSHQSNDVFSHSFTEHGILLGLCCIRTEHTYQQGINRAWFKKSRLDFYTPELANLGEMAVLNQEIYAQGTSEDKEAFGYQEAWAEMRHKPSIVTGEISSLVNDSLDIWCYADYYENKPTLGDKWISETKENVKRTLAVQDHDQFMFDFYFAPVYTRPLPLYSVPGLIDHH